MISILVMTGKFLRYKPLELIKGEHINKVFSMPKYYDSIYALEAIVILVIVYKILCVLRLNPYFDQIYITMINSVNLIILYIMFLTCILLPCSLIAQSLWGTFDSRYQSFTSSFLNTALSMITGIDITLWLFQSSGWSVVYFFFFMIWICLLIPNVCIGIFVESYRISALSIGYPETMKKDKWGVKQFFAWILNCCPVRLLNKLGLTEEHKEEDNER